MTNIEKLQAMSLNDLSLWLDRYGLFDNSPWMNWFDKEYCKNCESEKVLMENGNACTCAYCEIHEHCKFFPTDPIPVNYDIIKMWLQNEISSKNNKNKIKKEKYEQLKINFEKQMSPQSQSI